MQSQQSRTAAAVENRRLETEALSLLDAYSGIMHAAPAPQQNQQVLDAQMEKLRAELAREDEFYREHGYHIWARKPRSWQRRKSGGDAEAAEGEQKENKKTR